jgi:hypothetical protein
MLSSHYWQIRVVERSLVQQLAYNKFEIVGFRSFTLLEEPSVLGSPLPHLVVIMRLMALPHLPRVDATYSLRRCPQALIAYFRYPL